MTWLRDVVPLPADFIIAVFHLFLLALFIIAVFHLFLLAHMSMLDDGVDDGKKAGDDRAPAGNAESDYTCRVVFAILGAINTRKR